MRTLVAVLLASSALAAHSGPPYPILNDHVAGAYSISIWTDPDATDDGTKGGQFWVVLERAGGGEVVPGTRTTVTVAALDRSDRGSTAVGAAVDGDAGNQFAALLMDHEGPYRVAVTVSGPMGDAAVESRADATYDLRPPPYMLAWYLAPFILAGLLWGRLLMRRRKNA